MVPPDWCAGLNDEFSNEHVYQVETKAGDVVFFSEATVHGALPWTMPYERRLALYRFANANYAYGRAYLNEWSGAAARCTDAQKAVLLPPYAPRLERPMVPATGDAGEVVAKMHLGRSVSNIAFGGGYAWITADKSLWRVELREERRDRRRREL